MKKLNIFFLILLVFSVFIPKTYADTISSSNFLIDANIYNASLEHQSEVLNAQSVTVPSYHFPVFFGFQINNLNFSKSCDAEFGYRVDYTLFGWHNYQQKLNWVNYAKLITVNNPDIETIGTVLKIINNYTIEFSTFFIWRPSYCPVDTINSLNFRIADYARFPLNQNYFYSVNDYWNGGYYYVYDSLYEQVNISQAQKVVGEYYDTGSITQEKLDNIDAKLTDVNENLEETNEKLNNIYNNITNNDISGSQNTANSFFDNFTDNDYGLSSIITIPLTSIQKITNVTCTPINIPIPFTNKTIPLPCMNILYQENVPLLLNIWQIVSFGLISYAVIIDIFSMVKNFKNPNDDKLEVMSL